MSTIIRMTTQIGDTIVFEFRKNLKKMLFLLGITAVIIYLNLFLLGGLKQDLGIENPETIKDYLSQQFSLFTTLLTICATALFGSIIVEDVEKRTGNILFPKINKDRLIIGRFIALYMMFCIIIFVYYLAVIVSALSAYSDPIPKELWDSFAWALLYALALSAFVTFISSISKSVNLSVIFSILFLLIIFDIVITIIMFTGSKMEPLFVLTYYGNIITAVFKFPEQRYLEMDIYQGVEQLEGRMYRIWYTPSPEGALAGLLIYTIASLVLAYIFYRRKD
jgi:ABC-type transport system involved in multi-copper enzyme maturation permease subunit